MSERAQERFTRKKEWIAPIAPIALLSWAIWANCSWLLFCNERTERLAHGPLFKKSDVIESLMSLFKKEQLSKQRRERRATGAICLGHTKRKNCQKQIKNTIFYIYFLFRSQKWAIRSSHKQIINIAFFSWVMRAICSSCSFVLSNLSKLLTVPLWLRATSVIRSWLPFCHEQPEQIAHGCSLIW